MSWESTAEYYRLVNELVRERMGGLHSARLLVASLDFADIEALQAAGDWDEAGRILAEAARGLEAGGAGLLVLCTNTMHRVAGQVAATCIDAGAGLLLTLITRASGQGTAWMRAFPIPRDAPVTQISVPSDIVHGPLRRTAAPPCDCPTARAFRS